MQDFKEFQSVEFQCYQRLLKAEGFGFWEWVPEEDAVHLRGGFWRTLGYELGDSESVIRVSRLGEVIHSEDWHGFLKTTARVLGRGHRMQQRVRVRHSQGGYFWLCLDGEITRRRDLQISCVSGIAFDVSSQQELEQRLQKSEERLIRILDSSNDGIWEWTEALGGFHFSDRCWQQLGYDGHDDAMLMGRNRLEVWRELIHPEDRARFHQHLVDHLKDDSTFDLEYRVATKSGGWCWIRARGQCHRDGQGRAVSMSGTNMDITELKHTEERLVFAREEAVAASQAKSRFLSSMSHELRTPLNAILGYCQVFAMDSALSEQQQQSAREIRKAGNHLLQLINDVMDLSRIEAGQMSLSQEPVLVSRLLEECLTWIKPLADVRRIRILRDYGVLGEIYVLADATRLKQVLLNLISNAVKYNRESGLVTARLQASTGALRVDIEDTGRGIEEARQAEIFEPFNRLGAESSAIEGTGVGLSITRQLVNSMGGEMGFRSTPGKGSCFWVTFPSAADQEPAVEQNLSDAEIEQQPGLGDAPLRVLYIEDNPSNIRVLKQMLEAWPQVRLEVADEPFYGLYLARTSRPDVVLMDINLPRMDGFETLLFMQQDPCLQGIPVVALSANALPQDIERGKVAGFFEYLTKPVELPQLLAVLARLKVGGQ